MSADRLSDARLREIREYQDQREGTLYGKHIAELLAEVERFRAPAVRELVPWLRRSSRGACAQFIAGSKGAVLCHECEVSRLSHRFRQAADLLDGQGQE